MSASQPTSAKLTKTPGARLPRLLPRISLVSFIEFIIPQKPLTHGYPRGYPKRVPLPPSSIHETMFSAGMSFEVNLFGGPEQRNDGRPEERPFYQHR